MNLRTFLLPIPALLLGTLAACSSSSSPAGPIPHEETSPTAPDESLTAPFAVLPSATPPQAKESVSLGRRLFLEKRLSKSGEISCNSCHDLEAYGVDHQRVSKGHDGQLGKRNAPTVYNAAGHVAQFWDGRAATIEDQAKGPVLNPAEMAMPDAEAVEKVLAADPSYVTAFRAAFPNDPKPVSFDNMARAIGAFERGLVTPSRWDRYLAGDRASLTPDELHGLRTFVDTGCAGCHDGALVGGGSFEKLGTAKAWTRDDDRGRFDVTHDAKDGQVFKVPSLRNVAKTAPYLHDGSVATLDETVRLMADYQLGKELAPADVKAIVTWLESLTGELPSERDRPGGP